MGKNDLENNNSKKTISTGVDAVDSSTVDSASGSVKSGVKNNRGLIGIIVGIIVVVIIGVCVALVVTLNNNGGGTDGDSGQKRVSDGEAFDAMIEEVSNLKKEQIDGAKAEADATNDTEKKAEAFSKRINNMIYDEELDVVGALMDAGEEYFDDANNPAGTLAMYTTIDYDKLTNDPYVFHFYDKIMKLAEEVGDDEVKAEWQERYDKMKAIYDEYNAAFGDEDEGMMED